MGRAAVKKRTIESKARKKKALISETSSQDNPLTDITNDEPDEVPQTVAIATGIEKEPSTMKSHPKKGSSAVSLTRTTRSSSRSASATSKKPADDAISFASESVTDQPSVSQENMTMDEETHSKEVPSGCPVCKASHAVAALYERISISETTEIADEDPYEAEENCVTEEEDDVVEVVAKDVGTRKAPQKSTKSRKPTEVEGSDSEDILDVDEG